MFQVLSPFVLLGFVLSMLPWQKATAQQFNESDFVYEAVRNKIGLIRYCRNNGLLDPATADQAIMAVVRNIDTSYTVPRDQGDRAQKAGEEGFWGASRTRDIASVAKLFRTTPTDLCQEWAEETLRAQEPERRREIAAIAVLRANKAAPRIEPTPEENRAAPPVEPAPLENQTATLSEPAADENQPTAEENQPIVAENQPAPRIEPAPLAKKAAAAAKVPPLPERAPPAPILTAKSEPALMQHSTPTSARLTTANGGMMSGQMSGIGAKAMPSAMLHSSGQEAEPLSPPLAVEAEAPPPVGENVAATLPSPEPDGKSRSFWPFKRQGRSERCFMPGCKWPASQEKQSWGY